MNEFHEREQFMLSLGDGGGSFEEEGLNKVQGKWSTDLDFSYQVWAQVSVHCAHFEKKSIR